MQNELLLKREHLRKEVRILIDRFMKETDKEESRKIVESIRANSKEIEAINSKLAYIELMQKFKRNES